jgi:hypothetical protein
VRAGGSGGCGGSVTVVTHGASTPLVEQALRSLILEHDLRFDLIVVTQLWPLEPDEIVASLFPGTERGGCAWYRDW